MSKMDGQGGGRQELRDVYEQLRWVKAQLPRHIDRLDAVLNFYPTVWQLDPPPLPSLPLQLRCGLTGLRSSLKVLLDHNELIAKKLTVDEERPRLAHPQLNTLLITRLEKARDERLRLEGEVVGRCGGWPMGSYGIYWQRASAPDSDSPAAAAAAVAAAESGDSGNGDVDLSSTEGKGEAQPTPPIPIAAASPPDLKFIQEIRKQMSMQLLQAERLLGDPLRFILPDAGEFVAVLSSAVAMVSSASEVLDAAIKPLLPIATGWKPPAEPYGRPCLDGLPSNVVSGVLVGFLEAADVAKTSPTNQTIHSQVRCRASLDGLPGGLFLQGIAAFFSTKAAARLCRVSREIRTQIMSKETGIFQHFIMASDDTYTPQQRTLLKPRLTSVKAATIEVGSEPSRGLAVSVPRAFSSSRPRWAHESSVGLAASVLRANSTTLTRLAFRGTPDEPELFPFRPTAARGVPFPSVEQLSVTSGIWLAYFRRELWTFPGLLTLHIDSSSCSCGKEIEHIIETSPKLIHMTGYMSAAAAGESPGEVIAEGFDYMYGGFLTSLNSCPALASLPKLNVAAFPDLSKALGPLSMVKNALSAQWGKPSMLGVPKKLRFAIETVGVGADFNDQIHSFPRGRQSFGIPSLLSWAQSNSCQIEWGCDHMWLSCESDKTAVSFTSPPDPTAARFIGQLATKADKVSYRGGLLALHDDWSDHLYFPTATKLHIVATKPSRAIPSMAPWLADQDGSGKSTRFPNVTELEVEVGCIQGMGRGMGQEERDEYEQRPPLPHTLGALLGSLRPLEDVEVRTSSLGIVKEVVSCLPARVSSLFVFCAARLSELPADAPALAYPRIDRLIMKAGRGEGNSPMDEEPLTSYGNVQGCVRLICAMRPLVFNLTALADMSGGKEEFVKGCLSGCEREVEALYSITFRRIDAYENTYRLTGHLLQGPASGHR
ncbi:unnamed protein product [Vitrella brassicaformis CCMP3155]|uniref:Uncharacterized protein n=4 Tax=Vitrella brassicaformis TaxID=1169539 RepID=A0A0G4F8Z9_VITBC|nr:unnamed protein product [Vitrella brassicaformis CCMP3155]|eukprot:CEM08809.1 unnamed protein product [Vitrella brassicaformis CCMP3155]